MHEIATLNQEEFEKAIAENQVPVLVKFGAEWCGPCKAIGSRLAELEQDEQVQAKIYQVDVDQNPELAKRYQIKGIPSLLFFKASELKQTLMGLRSKSELAEALAELA